MLSGLVKQSSLGVCLRKQREGPSVYRVTLRLLSSAITQSDRSHDLDLCYAHASEYSWCNPPSIALASTERKSLSRCREVDNGTIEFAGGSGTPGPNAECGRPRL